MIDDAAPAIFAAVLTPAHHAAQTWRQISEIKHYLVALDLFFPKTASLARHHLALGKRIGKSMPIVATFTMTPA